MNQRLQTTKKLIQSIEQIERMQKEICDLPQFNNTSLTSIDKTASAAYNNLYDAVEQISQLVKLINSDVM